jgi:tetratricopeptide (TPR) repeat protein
MTLWHELAHVFHIGLSKNRVPRWFTEGLAEWETAHREVGWSRELDLSLLQAKNRDALPKLERMSRAFTRAKTHEDVATAYYASSKIVDWVIETRGEQTATVVLKEFGEKRLPNDVVPEVLRAPFPQLDEEFVGWLSLDLSRFDGQFVSKRATGGSKEAKARAEKHPDDPNLALEVGLALLSEGELKGAKEQLTKVRERWPLSKPGTEGSDAAAQAIFAFSRVHLAEENKQDAQALIEEILGAGYDGFELRMVLARTLLSLKQADEAEPHLLLASRFDEWDATPWGLLAALRHARGDEAGELVAVSRLARIEEHDPAAHHRLLELLLAQNKPVLAARAAELALWVDLAGTDTHRLAALAFSRAGDRKRANFEWESALLTPASEAGRKALTESWVAELLRLGRREEASRVKKRLQSAIQGESRP